MRCTDCSAAGCSWRVCLAAALLLGFTGCGSSPPSNTLVTVATPAPPKVLDETWDVCRIGDSKVGYNHTTIEEFVEDQRTLRRIRVENQLRITRFQQPTVQRLIVTSVETPGGKLVRFETIATSGPEESTTHGEVVGDRLELKITTLGKVTKTTLPWQNDIGGFFAAEQSLRHTPLQPGEKRSLSAIHAMVNIVGEIRLEAGEREDVRLLDGGGSLLKVRKLDVIGDTTIESFHWINERGETLRSVLPSLKLEMLRTTREVALADGERGSYDLGNDSIVRVRRPLNNPHGARRIVYRATLGQEKFEQPFASSTSQRVTKNDDGSMTIEVVAVRPTSPAAPADNEPSPTADDLAANNYIQSDHAAIKTLAIETLPGEQDAWTVATGLERAVFRLIRKKNFSQALATAAEVAESREGDCTEHAVLLAALCRARQIPARVAIGLIYYSPANGFAYHMWTEAWIADRWVPLDATLGQGGIGAGHIKISTSHLAGASALSPFLPVANLIGRLELEVVEVEAK